MPISRKKKKLVLPFLSDVENCQIQADGLTRSSHRIYSLILLTSQDPSLCEIALILRN